MWVAAGNNNQDNISNKTIPMPIEGATSDHDANFMLVRIEVQGPSVRHERQQVSSWLGFHERRRQPEPQRAITTC